MPSTRTKLREAHPAVQAYRKRWPHRAIRGDVEVLKGKPGKKTLACRLQTKVNGEEVSVIAKGKARGKTWPEQQLYAKVLPGLGVETPRLYGSATTEAYDWLFLEDLGEKRPSWDEHAPLLTQWLARMHVATSRQPQLCDIVPERGERYYRRENERVRTLLDQLLQPGHEHPVHRELLQDVREQTEKIGSLWPGITSFCERVPKSLVHGDWVEKNIRLVERSFGLAIIPFDWELAGWGVPAADLARVSPSAYREQTQSAWPNCTTQTFEELRALGQLFRYVSSTHWELSRWVASPKYAFQRRTSYIRKYKYRLAYSIKKTRKVLAL